MHIESQASQLRHCVPFPLPPFESQKFHVQYFMYSLTVKKYNFFLAQLLTHFYVYLLLGAWILKVAWKIATFQRLTCFFSRSSNSWWYVLDLFRDPSLLCHIWDPVGWYSKALGQAALQNDWVGGGQWWIGRMEHKVWSHIILIKNIASNPEFTFQKDILGDSSDGEKGSTWSSLQLNKLTSRRSHRGHCFAHGRYCAFVPLSTNWTILLGVFAGKGATVTQESKSSHPRGIATRKVRQQAAQNQLDLLDMGAFRRELDDVAKRLEDRCSI